MTIVDRIKSSTQTHSLTTVTVTSIKHDIPADPFRFVSSGTGLIGEVCSVFAFRANPIEYYVAQVGMIARIC